MYFRKRARTLVISCVAMLGLSASMAAGAQGNWLILHEKKIVESHVTLGVETHEHKTGNKFILLVPALGLEILCLKVESDPNALPLLLAGSTIGHGHVNFSECDTRIKGVENKNCKPFEPILAGGLGKLLLHIHQGVNLNYVLLEPLKGQPFTTIQFGELCVLPEEALVTGSLVVECGHLLGGAFALLDCAKHQVTHLFREAPEALFSEDGLRFGLNPALLDGIAAARINGPSLYVGDEWGGHV
jgi:hypothetical protein